MILRGQKAAGSKNHIVSAKLNIPKLRHDTNELIPENLNFHELKIWSSFLGLEARFNSNFDFQFDSRFSRGQEFARTSKICPNTEYRDFQSFLIWHGSEYTYLSNIEKCVDLLQEFRFENKIETSGSSEFLE